MKPCEFLRATVRVGAWVSVAAASVSVAALGGCASTRPAPAEARLEDGEHHEGEEHAPPPADAPRFAVVNAFCPIAGDHPVGENKQTTEDLTRMWRGQRVGFCCDQCPMWWDDMSDTERESALGAALKLERETAGDPK